MPERHFVKYTFLRVDPAWRRLDADQRAADKREFLAACEDFARRPPAAVVLARRHARRRRPAAARQAENLDRIHEFHVVLRPERADEVVLAAPLLPGA